MEAIVKALEKAEPRIYSAVRRLNGLYEDPAPGCFTWHEARQRIAQEIIDAINERRTDKERMGGAS